MKKIGPLRVTSNQTRTGHEFLRQNRVLHLVRKLDHRVHLFLRLLALSDKGLELGVHDVLPAQEGVHVLLLDRKPRFDRLLARPIFPVCLTLDEDLYIKCGKSAVLYI